MSALKGLVVGLGNCFPNDLFIKEKKIYMERTEKSVFLHKHMHQHRLQQVL